MKYERKFVVTKCLYCSDSKKKVGKWNITVVIHSKTYLSKNYKSEIKYIFIYNPIHCHKIIHT